MSDIIKTQQGLARKAQADKQHQFKDLYFLLSKREWVGEALQHILTNEGAKTPGVDGMSWKDFNDPAKSEAQNEKFREQFIAQIQLELRQHTYKPKPVRRVEIPKPDSTKKRPLGILTIKDRVVATLLKMVLEPIWESDFLYFSNGFRPTRCTMDCIQPLYSLFNKQSGYKWVIEGDIRACFGSLLHQKLLTEVKRRVADAKILRLIDHFLKSGIMQHGKFAPSNEGVSQGDPLSPLLANIYLHRLDEWFQHNFVGPDVKTDYNAYLRWARQRAKGRDKAAVQMYRYADDWILCVRGTKEQAQAIKEQCKSFLMEELGLQLSEGKTKLTHITDGFDFLGYHIFRNERPRDRLRVGVFIQPTKVALGRVKLKIKEMTTSRTLVDDYLTKLRSINAVTRGWANYYRAVNPFTAFQKLDWYVWFRVRRWLGKKHQAGTKQVRRNNMYHRPGPKGGFCDFAALDESNGRWTWRYRAVETKLIYYRPSFKKNWPNPYLEKLKVELFELPTLKTLWNGNLKAPIYAANRRVVLGRAKGCCERCGSSEGVEVHHRKRVKNKLKEADSRPEMLEALCRECHHQEHRAETIERNKRYKTKIAESTG